MSNQYWFVGGDTGPWNVTSIQAVTGQALDGVSNLQVQTVAPGDPAVSARWVLRGFVSNLRYAERRELDLLRERQEGLNRPQSRCAALIPIRKSPAWWALAQDERRTIFEEHSRHTEIGLDYLPAIARQLHHCRDIGEPFDFLTWFEFDPQHCSDFDALLARLRTTLEWSYVEREVEIRLQRIG